jgi:hypothetical protein
MRDSIIKRLLDALVKRQVTRALALLEQGHFDEARHVVEHLFARPWMKAEA